MGRREKSIFGVDNGVTTPDALLYVYLLQQRFVSYRLGDIFNWPYSDSIFHPKYFEFDFADHASSGIP